MKATIGRRLAISAAAAVAAAGLLATAASAAAAPCGPREMIAKELAGTFKETRTALGLLASGEVLEIFVSPSGTWTALISQPSGWACIVASGEAWAQLPPPKRPQLEG